MVRKIYKWNEKQFSKNHLGRTDIEIEKNMKTTITNGLAVSLHSFESGRFVVDLNLCTPSANNNLIIALACVPYELYICSAFFFSPTFSYEIILIYLHVYKIVSEEICILRTKSLFSAPLYLLGLTHSHAPIKTERYFSRETSKPTTVSVNTIVSLIHSFV